MSFGDILGQIMQQGLGGQAQTRGRLQQTADNMGGQAGGGLEAIFGQLQSALTGVGAGGAGGSMGGLADRARDFLGKEQVGGLSGAQIGGIGAAAGALLGGGLGGAAKGGAMAMLGTLALGALKAAREAQAAAAPADQALEPAEIPPAEIRAVTGEDSEKLVLKAMISAAKADGNIDQTEMQKIIGKISTDDVTPAEKQFVLDEMARPLDVGALAAEARNPAQAAQVYAASILSIDADTDAEKAYLRELAQALALDPAAVDQIHRMTGAPA